MPAPSCLRVAIAAMLFASLMLAGSALARSAVEIDDEVYPEILFPSVVLETSQGDIVVELDRRRAPVTVNNFLRYVESGRYDGTLFHRVVADFVVQGGGYAPDLSGIETFGPIINESGNGLVNGPGTIAMARHRDPHSGTSQFYFNLDNNSSLDPRRQNWGYTVFGRVLQGMEVVEAIAKGDVRYEEGLDSTDFPVEPVILQSARLSDDSM